jgi:hypothetical protein
VSREPGDSVVPGSGDDPTDLALFRYRQGDVLPELRSLAVLRVDDRGRLEVPTEQRNPSLLRRLPFREVMKGRVGHLLTRFFGGRPLRWVEQSTSNGAVLISQTCDVVRPRGERPTVQVAKLSRLEAERARAAADGRRPRFVAVPNVGPEWFADLEVIGTIDKRALVRLSRREGVVGDDQVRTFAGAVGRRFSRFPFPDEVTDQTNALLKEVQEKYGKEASPLGQVLQQVLELRLQAHPRWDDPDASITLFVICKPRVLPTFDEPREAPDELARWLRSDASGVANRAPSEIAERILNASLGSVEKLHLWNQLGRVWAHRCSDVTPTHGTRQQHQFDAEVLSANEFSLDRVRSSEILDVDYLSPPMPN